MRATVPARPEGLAALALPLLALVLVAGCSHLGPKSIPVDRFDYSSAIAESWKQQTLLNIVKLRYMDLPVFVDVSSIVAGYSMQTEVGAGGEFYPSSGNSGFASLGASGTFTDRPTVTYTPLTGDKFLRGVLRPIDPKNIFFLLQSGYAADFVLGLTVESLNGLHNRSDAGGVVREAEPEFRRVLELMREVQLAGGVGLRVVEKPAAGANATSAIFFRRENLSADVLAKAAEIRRLLHLPPEGQEFTLVFSPVQGAMNELAVNSRSMLQIMAAFSTYVDAPEEHLARHMTVPTVEHAASGHRNDEPVRILSGKARPDSAYASVRYRDYWFWIDDGDWRTKRALTAIMFFFTLEDATGNSQQPVITIPVQ